MKIIEPEDRKIAFHDVKPGAIFKTPDGIYFMRIGIPSDDGGDVHIVGESSGINMKTGEIESFKHYQLVVVVDAELIIK